MLPRSSRLKNPLLFQKAFRYGKPFFFGDLGCRVVFNGGGNLKIGFIAAKKMFRRATERNYVRRLLSEAVFPHLGSFPEDAYLVVSFRSRPESFDLEKIRKDISGLVRIISAETRKK